MRSALRTFALLPLPTLKGLPSVMIIRLVAGDSALHEV
jgi:hypothetical protein